ncbi:hypothetical protein F5882DRAFT_143692 [Hyaloscypha sp. PMI_1271]|nr:hypothetical protein F5882DRAFT_143692 [Hyaloscypha sp. PMI_1271]
MMNNQESTTPSEAGEAAPTARFTLPIVQDPVPEAELDNDSGDDRGDRKDEGRKEITTPDEADEAALTTPLAASAAAPPEVENEENEDDSEDEGSEWNDEDDDDDEYVSEDEENICGHEKRQKRKKPMPSLLALAERGILKQLTKAIDGQQVTARYCCGGRVRSLPPTTLPLQDEKPRKVPRLTMRWDDAVDRRGRKIHFPHSDSHSGSRTRLDTQIETLADRCEDTGVLDDYRFSINFDPHFYGITDVITQVLLPGFESEILKGVPECRGVRAKLSNLQVRSAGGTAYRPLPAHRSSQYFGKLIVCLPYPHKGGQWEISNDGHSTTIDFSHSDDNTTLHWAAVVGDCTHECQPVEEGHQLVLIYNLFLCQRIGEVLRDNSTADPTLFPLYTGVKEMLEHPGFMKKGGVLGFYCQYPYPHASSNTAKQLPSSLQGVDMVVYSVFKSLSLKTEILPLLDLSPLDEMDETEYEREEEYYHDDPWSYIDDYDFGDDFPECESCYPDFPTFEEWKAKRPRIDRVGTKLHSLRFSESSGDAGYIREAKEER